MILEMLNSKVSVSNLFQSMNKRIHISTCALDYFIKMRRNSIAPSEFPEQFFAASRIRICIQHLQIDNLLQ